ncbi:hypothetical protein M3Y96_00155100 [Aphelenchoides besseyi]|nr:hypothetical protein M3Y96_00155100 [Aphelenchoides besseyi]
MGLGLSIGLVIIVHTVKLEATECLMVVEMKTLTPMIQPITIVFTTWLKPKLEFNPWIVSVGLIIAISRIELSIPLLLNCIQFL